MPLAKCQYLVRIIKYIDESLEEIRGFCFYNIIFIILQNINFLNLLV